MNMKIGISIRLFTPDTGGLQLHAARLVEHLKARGEQVQVLTRAISKVPSFQELFWYRDSAGMVDAADICLLSPVRGLKSLLWISYKCCGRPALRGIGIRLYLAAYLRQTMNAFHGCDVIHHVGQGSEMIGFAAEAAARKLGVPFVIQPTIHPGQWGDGMIDFDLYHRADRLLVHTQFERDYFVENGFRQPIDIVGNGIDDRRDGNGERFRKAHGIEGVMVLFLGRKEEDKGYFLLREAFQLLKKKATLVCVGPGNVRGEEPGALAANRVVELGFLEECQKHDALAACEVFCVPSEGESFGLVFMEAARYAKPSVCRRIPVLEELLPDGAAFVGAKGLNGNVVVSAQDLASTLESLISSESMRLSLGDGAFSASTSFLWPVVVERFYAAYEQATSAK